jgi:hypothetical protein
MKTIAILLIIIGLAACQKDKVSQDICTIPSTVSYQQDIRPIMDAKCNNCHNYPGTGGIYLDSFQMVHNLATSGILMGCLTGDPNYTPMPPEGNSVVEKCELTLLQNWITAGAPNN